MNEISEGSIKTGVLKNIHCSDAMELERDKLAQRVLGTDNVPLSACRVWDAQQTLLPGTAAADDLAFVTGTLGTNMPSIQTGDLKAAGATTRYASLQAELPEDYEDGQTVTVELVAGMKTTVADVSATIDLQAYRSAEDGTVGSDLCATAAQSINSLTAATKSFTLTPTSLVAGDLLDLRIAIAVNDAATATAVIGCLYAIKVRSDRR